jgi:hypothetical protein
MCRIVLAYLFPSVFSSGPTKSSSLGYASNPRSHSESQNHTTSSRTDWSPFQGGAEKVGIRMTTVHAKPRVGDDTSEEYILTPTDPQGRRKVSDEEDARVIRKVTQYGVTYDDNPNHRQARA